MNVRITSAAALASVAVSALLCTSALAVPYQVFVDTSALAGTSGQLALDFLDGGLPANGVSISAFSTTGTLGTTSSIGDVTGALPGTVTLADADFFNEQLADITLGTSISFIFTPTANAPLVGSLPDSLSVFLLDPLSGLSLFATSDPTGADALFRFDIDGAASGALSVFAAGGQEVVVRVTPQQAVPEPSTALLLAVGIAGALWRRHPLRRGAP